LKINTYNILIWTQHIDRSHTYVKTLEDYLNQQNLIFDIFFNDFDTLSEALSFLHENNISHIFLPSGLHPNIRINLMLMFIQIKLKLELIIFEQIIEWYLKQFLINVFVVRGILLTPGNAHSLIYKKKLIIRSKISTPINPPSKLNLQKKLFERKFLIGFVGTLYPNRLKLIMDIENQGYEVAVPVNLRKLLVPNSYQNKTLRASSNLSDEEYWNFMSDCVFLLNFSELEETNSQYLIERSKTFKGRVLESAYCGCITLWDEVAITQNYLTPGKEFLYFENSADVVQILEEYLHDKDKFVRIASDGFNKSKNFIGFNFWKLYSEDYWRR